MIPWWLWTLVEGFGVFMAGRFIAVAMGTMAYQWVLHNKTGLIKLGLYAPLSPIERAALEPSLTAAFCVGALSCAIMTWLWR